MKIRFQIIILFAMLISSCQKELSLESNGSNNGGGGGGGISTGNLLTKVASKSGNDSIVATYTYDASNRVSRYETIDVTAGISSYAVLIYSRNAANGLITSYKQVITSTLLPPGSGADTAIYYVRYDMAPSVPRIKNVVGTISFLGFTSTDSSVLSYDAAGRIISQVTYTEDFLTGTMELTGSYDYTYDGKGNILSEKGYVYNSGVKELDTEVTYENYDSKVNPYSVFTVAEACLIGGPGKNSPNNSLRIINKNYGASSGDQTNVITYQYRSDGRPISGVGNFTLPGGNISRNYTFSYK